MEVFSWMANKLKGEKEFCFLFSYMYLKLSTVVLKEFVPFFDYEDGSLSNLQRNPKAIQRAKSDRDIYSAVT